MLSSIFFQWDENVSFGKVLCPYGSMQNSIDLSNNSFPYIPAMTVYDFLWSTYLLPVVSWFLSHMWKTKNTELADTSFMPVHLYWQYSAQSYWMFPMHSSRGSSLPLLELQFFQEEKIKCINQRLIILGFTSRHDSLKSLWFFKWGQSDIALMVFVSSTWQNSQTML